MYKVRKTHYLSVLVVVTLLSRIFFNPLFTCKFYNYILFSQMNNITLYKWISSF